MSPSLSLVRIDTTKLYPPFLALILRMISGCNARGALYHATSGYRSFVDQGRLYFQGRTQPGKIVSNSQPGYSAHQYGIAVDFCRIDDNGSVSWTDADYEVLGEEAHDAGLLWGGVWKSPDRPHVQLPGFVHPGDFATIKSIYEEHVENPLPPVWQWLEDRTPVERRLT